MAASLPSLSTFLGLSPNFLNGPASIPSRLNLLLFGSSSQLVPIEFTNFNVNIPPILGAPLTGGNVFPFPPLTGNPTGGVTPNTLPGNNANALLGLLGNAGNVLSGNGGTQFITPSLNGGAPLSSGAGNPLAGIGAVPTPFGSDANSILSLLGNGGNTLNGGAGTQGLVSGLNGFSSIPGNFSGAGGDSTSGIAGGALPFGNNSNPLLSLSDASAFPGTPFAAIPHNQAPLSNANSGIASLLAMTGINNSLLSRLF